jgi:predicted TIM-barrel fold metal-dependent hydrolase
VITARIHNKGELFLRHNRKNRHSDMLIIDSHNHIGMDIHGVIQEPRSLLKKMVNSGVNKCVIFPFNEIRPGRAFAAANDYIAKVVKSHPERFIGFARTDPTHPSAADEVYRAIKKLGLKGLKLHPRSQEFHPSDDEIIPVLEMCVNLKVPILFHSGYAYRTLPPAIGEMADRFPELPVIMGHMGCSDVGTPVGIDDAIRIAGKAENLYLETSRMMISSYIAKAVRLVGEDKVIFGSDTPYGRQEDEIEVILKSELDSFSLTRIFSENIRGLLNLK